jgi:hypothetical protein
MVAERKGWVFPTFAEDPVIQLCVEEALMARIDAVKAREAEDRHKRAAVAAAQKRAQEEIERRRRG